MSHRMPGETLAIRDRVAMTPTVQPAAAGTHEYREALRVKVTVIGREDIRSSREIVVMRARGDRGNVYRTGPVYFSPGPCPGSSGAALDSRNANCSVFSPSRTGPACGPRYSADAVTKPASAVISRRASSRSRCGLSSGSSADRPSFSAAALINMTAERVITSTAGISESSRMLVGSVMPARLARATVPAYARDSKWSPTPTADHIGSAVRSQASDACPGRLWALL